MANLDGHLVDIGKVAIVGTGLLGGSIGLALRQANFAGRIVGVGHRQQTLDLARNRGCIDEGFTAWGPAMDGCGLVILAAPLGAFAQILQELAPYDHPDLILTDVGSTKQLVCEDVYRLLPRAMAQRFVGSHPMAGKELHGPEHARADLFQDATCVITAQPDTNPDARAVVEGLWRTLGMRLIDMTPAEHDRNVARISHLPHALAVLLVELAAQQGGLEVAATGFRDTTRVASGDPRIWADIFTTNRAAVMQVIDTFRGELDQFRELLAKSDPQAMQALLQQAKDHRDAWLRYRSDCNS
jgi:prephenate dehydrogenase